jgi:hypothetical protein
VPSVSPVSPSIFQPAKTFLHSLYQQPCFFTFSATDFFFTFSATAVSSLSQEQQQKNFFSSSADDRSSADFLRSEFCFILEELDPEPNASDHIP